MTMRLAAVVALVLVLSGCAGESEDTSDAPAVAAGATKAAASPKVSPKAGESGDASAKITKCGRNEYGAYWKGTLKNRSDETSDFFITAEIIDSKGDRVDDAGTMATKVRAGQSVKLDAVGLGDVKDLPKKFSCRLVSVDRVPSSD